MTIYLVLRCCCFMTISVTISCQTHWTRFSLHVLNWYRFDFVEFGARVQRALLKLTKNVFVKCDFSFGFCYDTSVHSGFWFWDKIPLQFSLNLIRDIQIFYFLSNFWFDSWWNQRRMCYSSYYNFYKVLGVVWWILSEQ